MTENKPLPLHAPIVADEASLPPRPAVGPDVEAYRHDGRLWLTCPHCGKTHFHGLGDGHRVAHCSGALSNPLGYVLREAGEKPPPGR